MEFSRNIKNCLISIINNPQNYFDRCYLLTKIGNEKLQHVILTNGKIENDNKIYCTVLSPERSLKANDFWSWGYQQVKVLVNDNPKLKFILHEHGVGIVGAMLRIFFRKKILKICSLYSGEFAFFMNRGWTIDPNGRKFVTTAQKWKIIKSRFKPLFYRFISVFGANIIIGNSEEAANELITIFRSKKRVVMNTCILVNRFIEDINIKDTNQYLSSKENFQLLYAGKIYPAKGIGTLLKSFAMLQAEEQKKFQLTIIGKIAGNDKPWFFKMMEEYSLEDSIKIIPKVPQKELIQHYKKTNLLILPSFFEGSPRVMKEAIASGALVLCSNIAGTKVVDPKGEVSFFFEAGNAQELTNQIKSICTEKQSFEKRKKKGQDFIESFSAENLLKERLAFYKKLFREHER